jgi:predicted nucleic acid-binding protein
LNVLVDSNIILDLIQEDPDWFEWSAQKLEHHAERDILVINPIIYAEVAPYFAGIEELEEALPPSDYLREPLPWEAAYLAGRAFLNYKRRGGTRTSPLPDFYIGAHAAVMNMTVLTRDPRRFRNYYPNLKLICPDA